MKVIRSSGAIQFHLEVICMLPGFETCGKYWRNYCVLSWKSMKKHGFWLTDIDKPQPKLQSLTMLNFAFIDDCTALNMSLYSAAIDLYMVLSLELIYEDPEPGSVLMVWILTLFSCLFLDSDCVFSCSCVSINALSANLLFFLCLNCSCCWFSWTFFLLTKIPNTTIYP